MKLEHVTIKPLTLAVFLICFIVSSLIIIQVLLTPSDLKTNWRINFAGGDETFRTGQAIDFQLFLEDELGQALENAKVKVVFDRPGTVHQIEKNMYHVQDTLYETEVVFSLPGTWIAMVEVERGSSYYRNQILFNVGGPIVANVNRDPDDYFNLNQSLPDDLEELLKDVPAFTN